MRPSRLFTMMAAVLATSVSTSLLQAQPSDKFDWMQSGAAESEIYRSVNEGNPALDSIIGTQIPKPTANAEMYKREYVLDLKKYGIYNDGTHAVETSKGLNQALQYAKTININRIVFPKGTYLISELDPVILDHQDTIIDLNQSVLQMNTNGIDKNTIVLVRSPARNMRLTNGSICGDRDTHDYKTIKGSREHNMGLSIHSGVNLEIDHLTISNVPGSGLSTRSLVGAGARVIGSVGLRELTGGEITDTGKLEKSDKTLITTRMYDLSKSENGFEFGYTLGYQSYPSIKSRIYVAAFYDANEKFISREERIQFKKEAFPKNAKYVRLQFNQPQANDTPEKMVGRITDLDMPTDVHFHDNLLENNRTLGMAFCGGQRWVIENNRFIGNGGNSPGFGVDFEDGWDLMREVVFRKNTFSGNHAGDLVVCAGTEMIFSENTFVKAVVFYDRVHNYEFSNNKLTGSKVLFKTGIKHAVIHHNTYNGGSVQVRWNDNDWPNLPPLRLTNETFENLDGIYGRFLALDDCTIRNIHMNISGKNELLAIRNSTLENFTLKFDATTTAPLVQFEKCKITMDGRQLVTADICGFKSFHLIDNVINNQSSGSTLWLRSNDKCDSTHVVEIKGNKINQNAGGSVVTVTGNPAGHLQIQQSQNQSNRKLFD